MKLLSLLKPNMEALWARGGYGRETTAETFRRGFELCVVAHDPHGNGVTRALSTNGATLLVKLPALLSSSDVKRAKAVTKSSWYVLSGSHRTSTLLLKLKPETIGGGRVHEAIDQVVHRGDQVAILLDGEIVGVLVFQHALNGGEIAIDASFFSDGTEKEKELETRRLAEQINATLD